MWSTPACIWIYRQKSLTHGWVIKYTMLVDIRLNYTKCAYTSTLSNTSEKRTIASKYVLQALFTRDMPCTLSMWSFKLSHLAAGNGIPSTLSLRSHPTHGHQMMEPTWNAVWCLLSACTRPNVMPAHPVTWHLNTSFIVWLI